jgi:hypothetical protein
MPPMEKKDANKDNFAKRKVRGNEEQDSGACFAGTHRRTRSPFQTDGELFLLNLLTETFSIS